MDKAGTLRPVRTLAVKWRRLYAPLLILLMASACGGLAGEPEIIGTIPPTPDIPRFPLRPPDVERGAAIFADRCTSCHGIEGRGDGELVASGQVPQAANFTDPATAREQTPLEWFETITNGRLEKLMPPWGQELSAEERWDVAFYTYTLAYPPEQIALGQQVWESTCAECHGISGLGDGQRAPEVNRPIADLTDLSQMVAESDQMLYTIITEGSGPAMPAFVDDLDEAQRRAVAAYVRTLALVNTDAAGVPAQVPAAVEPVTGTVIGLVTNGTVTGTVPADQTVILHILDAQFNDDPRETTVDADGRFVFSDTPFRADRRYIVTTVYRESIFVSEAVSADPDQTLLDLPVTIYELTEDPAVLKIDRIETQMTPDIGGLNVLQLFELENTSDRLYKTTPPDSDTTVSVVIGLPPGTIVLGFPGHANATGRFALFEEQSVVVDNVPVAPGAEHTIQINYVIPYNDGAIIEQPIFYQMQGDFNLNINSDTITVTSDQLESRGSETIGRAIFQTYGGTLDLASGDVIRYELTGDIAPVVADTGSDSSIITGEVIGPVLAVIGVILIVGAGILYWRGSQEKEEASQEIDALIREIAELDDLHEQGQINHDLYHQERTILKEQLATLMSRDTGEDETL